jgi:hypothetical protein
MKDDIKKNEPKLIWRLSERPTVDNISKLVEQGIINQAQARKLLFEETTNSQIKTMEDVQKELVLLRRLVSEIAQKEGGYQGLSFFHPYKRWIDNNTWTITI